MNRRRSYRSGFTTIELLIVIAIVGIVAAISTPLYVGWRADTRATEAARTVETAIARARSGAKADGTTRTMSFENEATTFFDGTRDVTLPNGASLNLPDGNVELAFAPPFGNQVPFALEQVEVTAGRGAFERNVTISIIPPMGKTATQR